MSRYYICMERKRALANKLKNSFNIWVIKDYLYDYSRENFPAMKPYEQQKSVQKGMTFLGRRVTQT
jgi:hypothetical protein